MSVHGRSGHFDAGNLTAACGTSLIGRLPTARVTCRRCRASKAFKGALWARPIDPPGAIRPDEDKAFWDKLRQGLTEIATDGGYGEERAERIRSVGRSMLELVESRLARESQS